LTNASLFANLTLHGLPELVPGRLFTTRMPRDIVKDMGERKDFVEKCRKNQLKVACVLTEPHEFEKYSGTGGLIEFYKEECGMLAVYNRSIPDFQIPTSGDLVDNILDLTWHLAEGHNCLIHCAGGSGRTGMVVAAIVKNLGCYDPVARIRKVKSTYVETFEQVETIPYNVAYNYTYFCEQELFLRGFPKALDSRIVRDHPWLAKAIAAEHLIQVFYTHGEGMEGAATSADAVEAIDDEAEEKMRKAYLETFDLVDSDGSGTLDEKELKAWLGLCGAELDLGKIIDTLTARGELTRDNFAKQMATSASASRREYDIGGSFH